MQGMAKERFNEIKQELSQISTQFSNNLLDATKAFKRLVTAKEDVEGLPASALALGAQQASLSPWLHMQDCVSISIRADASWNRRAAVCRTWPELGDQCSCQGTETESLWPCMMFS